MYKIKVSYGRNIFWKTNFSHRVIITINLYRRYRIPLRGQKRLYLLKLAMWAENYKFHNTEALYFISFAVDLLSVCSNKTYYSSGDWAEPKSPELKSPENAPPEW